MTGQIPGPLPMPGFDDAACTARHDLWDARGLHADEARRQVCHACPALPECFAWALSVKDGGFWAGMSATQRGQVRARYGIAVRTRAATP